MIARLFPHALALVVAAQFAVAEPTIFMVRHAEKSDSAADPKNPDLSATGRQRAASLARMLKDAEVSVIFATEFARTQQTAEELRRATGAAINVVPAQETSTLIAKVKASAGNAVVIGHSNTLPDIIKALGVEKPITIGDSEYDNLFLWSPSSPRDLVRLRY